MVSAILAIIIVNLGQKLIMKITGTSVMFFSLKKKIIWYIIVWFILLQFIGI